MKISMLSSLSGRRVAFTMAEILLSLTIIGVVAAITLPSLTGNINERTWNTQRKALYSRMSQAIALIDNLRGYGRLTQTGAGNEWGGGKSYEFGDSTEAFLSGGLSKVMKLNNICDASHITDCGMPNQIVDMAGSKVQIDGSAMGQLTSLNEAFAGNGCAYFYVNGNNAAFETANGESVLAFYNPICKDMHTAIEAGALMQPSVVMCLNFVYDLNGRKGPNTVGKDIGFMSVFYPYDSVVVAPMPLLKDAASGVTFQNASRACTSQSDEYRIPNKEEFMSIGLNAKFVGQAFQYGDYWTSSILERTINEWHEEGQPFVWHNETSSMGARMELWPKTSTASVKCIKRF